MHQHLVWLHSRSWIIVNHTCMQTQLGTWILKSHPIWCIYNCAIFVLILHYGLLLTGALLIFESLNLKEDDIQLAAGYYPVETTVQARALFLHTHSWLKRVKSFYTLNEYPLEYVNAILDLSELYRYLAFYEEDIERYWLIPSID